MQAQNSNACHFMQDVTLCKGVPLYVAAMTQFFTNEKTINNSSV